MRAHSQECLLRVYVLASGSQQTNNMRDVQGSGNTEQLSVLSLILLVNPDDPVYHTHSSAHPDMSAPFSTQETNSEDGE